LPDGHQPQSLFSLCPQRGLSLLFVSMPQDLVVHRDLQILLAPGPRRADRILERRHLTGVSGGRPSAARPAPFPFPGERPPGGDPAFLAPWKREWLPNSQQRSRQQAAEDLPWIIERFANCADMIGRSTYKALVAIFNRQCEVSKGKVVVKARTGGECIQAQKRGCS